MWPCGFWENGVKLVNNGICFHIQQKKRNIGIFSDFTILIRITESNSRRIFLKSLYLTYTRHPRYPRYKLRWSNPRNISLKKFKITFYKVKDYISKTNRVSLQRITLHIASVYTAACFRYFSQVHKDKVLYFRSSNVWGIHHLLQNEPFFPQWNE